MHGYNFIANPTARKTKGEISAFKNVFQSKDNYLASKLLGQYYSMTKNWCYQLRDEI